MVLLDIAFVFFISALTGMGVGGGGLPVLFFSMVRGFPQRSAQGMCVVLFIASVIGAYTVNRKKRSFDLGIIPYIAVTGCIFAFLGASLVNQISSVVLRRLFGALLTITGIYAALKRE